MVLALSDETTSITTGVTKLTFRVPYTIALYQIPRASVNTASTSGAVTVDIKQNGVSIFGNNKLTIDALSKTSVTSIVQPILSTAYIPDDTEITFDITTAGTSAKGLKIVLYYKRT